MGMIPEFPMLARHFCTRNIPRNMAGTLGSGPTTNIMASIIMDPHVPTRKVRLRPNLLDTNTPPMEMATNGAMRILENTP